MLDHSVLAQVKAEPAAEEEVASAASQKNVIFDASHVFGISGSMLAYTPYHETKISDLMCGDTVMTFPAGFQEVERVEQVEMPTSADPVVAFTSRNYSKGDGQVYVRPEQRFLIRNSVECQHMFGKPDVLLNAEDICGLLGAELCIIEPVSFYQICFSKPALLWSVQGLVECPGIGGGHLQNPAFSNLSDQETTLLRAHKAEGDYGKTNTLGRYR